MKSVYFSLIFGLWIIYILPSFSQTCKRGVIDCTGLCGRFTDNDEDGICDFSPRSTPVKDSITERKSSSIQKDLQETTTSKQKEIINKTTKTNQIKADTSKNKTKEKITEDTIAMVQNQNLIKTERIQKIQPKSQIEKIKHKRRRPYPLLEICSLTLGLYLVSWLLVKFNIWRKQTHRKLWNTILLITFLMSGVLGFFLVVQLNYHLFMDNFRLFMKLHVLFGITMAIVSVIHILWHLKYYINIFKNKESIRNQ